jgi:arylsulfatase A-like enzyme
MHFLLPLILLASQVGGGATEAGDKPNVIVIMTDDQGWGDFGFHGNPVLDTPALDRLASQSTRLNTFYVHPVCTPTRSALMTGRYPQRTRAFDTYIGRAMLEPEEVTMAEVFREAGWSTGIFGKWHLGDCYPMRAMDQGFDESLVIRGGGIGQPSDPEGAERKYTNPILFRNGKAEQAEGYCTDAYFDAGIQWMTQQHKDGQPFLMYLPTNAPHGPFHDVPEELLKKYMERDLKPAFAQPKDGHRLPEDFQAEKLARIFAMIENVDQNVAKLDRALEELGILDNTIVVYLNDNGPNTRRAVGGRRGMKASIYEGGVRSPLWMRWPKRLEASEVNGVVGANIDVLPTLADACEIEWKEDLAWDGRSFWAAMERGSKPGGGLTRDRKHPLVIQAQRGDVGIRYHNFLLRTDRWKMVSNTGFSRELKVVEPKFELYDMNNDTLELVDVATKNPEVIAQLKQQYDRWFDDVSTTRSDNWSPPPIVIGSDASPDVCLTRQDWRKLDGPGWSSHSQGHWSIDAVHKGPYDVRVRFLPSSKVNQLDLHCGAVSRKVSTQADANEITLQGVMLPEGRNWLRFDLALPGKTVGPYQVEFHRIDP